LCGLTDLVVSQASDNLSVRTGDLVTYSLIVQRSGECEGTGITLTDTLPAGMQFVSASSPQGTWSEANGVVTFHLGLLQDVYLEVTVTARTLVPGLHVNAVLIRGNEREQNLNNNSSSLTVQAEGPALPRAQSASAAGLDGTPIAEYQETLAARLTNDGFVQVQLTGEVGIRYTIETSTDLTTWAPWTEVTSSATAISLRDKPGAGFRFYRAVRR
jgi:uncharacterized repeat protein (TIGR01451 family)